MKRILPFLAIAALTIVATSVLAQTSTNFDQSWHVLSGAGAPASSANFAADGSLSQLAIGMPRRPCASWVSIMCGACAARWSRSVGTRVPAPVVPPLVR